MKHLKTFCIMLLVALFALQTTASVAVAACDCGAMQMDDSASDMPCHDMDKASTDDSKMADCDSCGCGHCMVTASAALTDSLSASHAIFTDSAVLSANNYTKSFFPYGIDHPPRTIS